MQKLELFILNNVSQTTPKWMQSICVNADLIFLESKKLQAQFQIIDEQDIFAWPEESLSLPGIVFQRKDDLWKETCFEVFLQPEFSQDYYELNFSLSSAWNCYHFDEYRNPQPPKQSQFFNVEQLVWQPTLKKLIIDMSMQETKKFNIGLTTILRSTEGAVGYYALKHVLDKPDFHQKDSFILHRGS